MVEVGGSIPGPQAETMTWTCLGTRPSLLVTEPIALPSRPDDPDPRTILDPSPLPMRHHHAKKFVPRLAILESRQLLTAALHHPIVATGLAHAAALSGLDKKEAMVSSVQLSGTGTIDGSPATITGTALETETMPNHHVVRAVLTSEHVNVSSAAGVTDHLSFKITGISRKAGSERIFVNVHGERTYATGHQREIHGKFTERAGSAAAEPVSAPPFVGEGLQYDNGMDLN